MANQKTVNTCYIKPVFGNLLAFTCLLLVLSSCSQLPDWLGESKKASDIKGKRISVMSFDSVISPNSELASTKVLIPLPAPNEAWVKSNGMPVAVPENQLVPHDFPVRYIVGVGGGSADGEHMTAAPIIAANKVFIISAGGKVSAFNAFDVRTPIWRIKLDFDRKNGSFSSAAGMTYDSGRLYIATGYNEVDALDAATGKIIWKRSLSSIARSAPEVKGKVVYVNTIDNRIYAMDSADGGILWTHIGGAEEISVFGSAPPVVSGETLIAPYSSGEVYALKTTDGTEIWSDSFARRAVTYARTLSDIDAPPVINSGKVYLVSNDGLLAASDLATGKRLWEQPFSGRQSPWVAGDFLYIISNSNELACISTKSGGIKWVKQLKSYKNEDSKSNPISWSGPVLAGDWLWMVGSNGNLMALSPRDGALEYERAVPDDIYLPPIMAYGNIYLYSDDAELIQLSSKK